MIRSRIKRKHTKVYGTSGFYRAKLVIGVQSFVFARVSTRKEAEWYCDRMAEALENFLVISQKED